MPFAPSVGMHEVPKTSVGKATGIVMDDNESDGDSDIDAQINRPSESHEYTVATVLGKLQRQRIDQVTTQNGSIKWRW